MTERPPNVGLKLSAAAAVAVIQNNYNEAAIDLFLQPGEWCVLEAVTVGGTPSFTLGIQEERIFG